MARKGFNNNCFVSNKTNFTDILCFAEVTFFYHFGYFRAFERYGVVVTLIRDMFV